MKTALYAISMTVFFSLPGKFMLLIPCYFELPVCIIAEVDQEVSERLPQDFLSAMEGLDLVKSAYASDFIKKVINSEEYYYESPIARYYLVYEGRGEDDTEYLYHLYEFVLDDEAEGIGHTVTYGWYTVDKYTETIAENTQ